MKKQIGPGAIVGIIAAVVIILGVVGYMIFLAPQATEQHVLTPIEKQQQEQAMKNVMKGNPTANGPVTLTPEQQQQMNEHPAVNTGGVVGPVGQ